MSTYRAFLYEMLAKTKIAKDLSCRVAASAGGPQSIHLAGNWSSRSSKADNHVFTVMEEITEKGLEKQTRGTE